MDSKNSLLTTSCTHALEMMSLLLNIEKDDEIIVLSYTFVSTANTFAKYGAKIVLVNPSSDNPDIDPNVSPLVSIILSYLFLK